MKNYKLIISYDGTDFYGFQIQKDKTTVQGELQKALEIFTEKYELNYSGRTDAGVHAKGQVINIKTELVINDKTINSLKNIHFFIVLNRQKNWQVSQNLTKFYGFF